MWPVTCGSPDVARVGAEAKANILRRDSRGVPAIASCATARNRAPGDGRTLYRTTPSSIVVLISTIFSLHHR